MRAAPLGGAARTTRPAMPLPAWVLIVDDHDVFASNLARTLAAEDDLRVIGTSATAAEARRCLVNAVPDVVLVSHRLPDGDAVDALGALIAIQPSARFLLMTERPTDELLVRAVEAGVSGFVEQTQSLAGICSAVRATHRGDAVIARPVLTRVLPLMRCGAPLTPARVTARDRRLLGLLAEGLTNAELAERKAVAMSEVQLQVAELFARLGARSRLEALSVAARMGVLGDDGADVPASSASCMM